jgi:hypothetical protein
MGVSLNAESWKLLVQGSLHGKKQSLSIGAWDSGVAFLRFEFQSFNRSTSLYSTKVTGELSRLTYQF